MRAAALAILLAALASAQPFRWTREQMIHHTPQNPFERFEDGRPKVPDALLEKVKGLSAEEAWGVLRNKGYLTQFAGSGFRVLHPGQKLVGRALTAQYLPARPDLQQVLDADAKAAGMPDGINQRVIDLLQLNDVPVVDLMGVAPGHNFGGDNLHAAIYGATRTGAVVDGTVRDIEGLAEMPNHLRQDRNRIGANCILSNTASLLTTRSAAGNAASTRYRCVSSVDATSRDR